MADAQYSFAAFRFRLRWRTVERADALREDADVLARLWPGARILVLDHDGSAFTGDDDQPLALTGADVGGGPGAAVFLGLRGDQAWFSVEASNVTVSAPRRLDLRQAALLWPMADATAFSYARGMSYWHSRTRFCGVCGGAVAFARGGFVYVVRSVPPNTIRVSIRR